MEALAGKFGGEEGVFGGLGSENNGDLPSPQKILHEIIELIDAMMQYSPSRRLSADKALEMYYKEYSNE